MTNEGSTDSRDRQEDTAAGSGQASKLAYTNNKLYDLVCDAAKWLLL